MMSIQPDSGNNLFLVNNLIEACRKQGDLGVLLRLLKEDIRLYTDDGAGPADPPRLLFGIGQCIKFLEGIHSSIAGPHYWQLRFLQGRPAALFFRPRQKTPHALLIIEKQDSKIHKMQFLRHPERIYRQLSGMVAGEAAWK